MLKLRIALAVAFVALAAVSALDSASASNRGLGGGPSYYPGGGFLYRAPQPGQSPRGATSRPLNPKLRGVSSYRVNTDDSREVPSYERIRRINRGQAD